MVNARGKLGTILRTDPAGGSCMFQAASYQIPRTGIYSRADQDRIISFFRDVSIYLSSVIICRYDYDYDYDRKDEVPEMWVRMDSTDRKPQGVPAV
jgi:hypothetical protein